MRVVSKKIPGEWENIKAMFVKTSNSVALPVYQASPLATYDLTEVEQHGEEKAKKRKRKRKKTPTLKETNIEETSLDSNEQTLASNEDTKSVDDIIDESDVESVEDEEEDEDEEELPKKKRKKKISKKSSIPSKKKKGPRTIKSK